VSKDSLRTKSIVMSSQKHQVGEKCSHRDILRQRLPSPICSGVLSHCSLRASNAIVDVPIEALLPRFLNCTQQVELQPDGTVDALGQASVFTLGLEMDA
jgi:hypothetical protein